MIKEKAEILDEKAMTRAIARISYEILEKNKGTENLCILGIKTRGVGLAQRIARKIEEVEGKPVPVGVLDISPYRDDRETAGASDQSEISFETRDKKIVLVDDVIYTGRSARAAIDAVMKRGRPRTIQLAALIDRGHRELPIRADYVGKNVPTSKNEQVKVMIQEVDGISRVAIFADDANE